jgi:hypothetical protein
VIGFDYRVVKEKDETGRDTYKLREVFYTPEGMPFRLGAVVWENGSEEGLRTDVQHMSQAYAHPILYGEDFKK